MIIAQQAYRKRLRTLDYAEAYRPSQPSEPFLLFRRIARKAFAPRAGAPLSKLPLIVDKHQHVEMMLLLRRGSGARSAFASNPACSSAVPTLRDLAERHAVQKQQRRGRVSSSLLVLVALVALIAAAFVSGARVHRLPQWVEAVTGG